MRKRLPLDKVTMSEMDKIIGRRVSETVQQTDSRYESEKKSLLADLSEPGFLNTLAIHEAGHEHFYLEAGAYGMTFDPPVILFRPQNTVKPFKKQLARIEVGGYTSLQDKDWFLKLAKGYAAGGVCSETLSSSRYRGDRTDRDLWNQMCADSFKNESLSEKEVKAIAEDYWNRARRAVQCELNGFPKLKIQNRAEEIMPLLFPWQRGPDSR